MLKFISECPTSFFRIGPPHSLTERSYPRPMLVFPIPWKTWVRTLPFPASDSLTIKEILHTVQGSVKSSLEKVDNKNKSQPEKAQFGFGGPKGTSFQASKEGRAGKIVCNNHRNTQQSLELQLDQAQLFIQHVSCCLIWQITIGRKAMFTTED